MKMLAALTTLIFAASAAQAAQFTTIKANKSSVKYESVLTYPRLLAGSVPAYRQINKALVANIMEGACDAGEAAKSDYGYNYDVTGVIVALNPNYVGVSLTTSSDCGGAHPNYGTYYLTFNSQTGEMLDISLQFGFQNINDPNYDIDKDEAQRLKVAEILVNHIPKDVEESCFSGMNRQEKLDELTTLFPIVAGLAKGGKVVFGVSPAHVAEVCEFYVRLPYADVKEMIIPGSYLEKWMGAKAKQPSVQNLLN